MISAGFLFGQRWYAAAARRATLLGEGYWHRVTSSIFARIARDAAPCCGCFFRRPWPLMLRTFVRLACLVPILGALVCHGIVQAGPAGAPGGARVGLRRGGGCQPGVY